MRTSRLIATVSFIAAVAHTAPAQTTTWPTKGWPTTTPQAAGLNAAVLDSIDAEIASGMLTRLLGAVSDRRP